jgi:predicted HTH transcriptional regulator
MQYVIGSPTSEDELNERTEFKKMSEMAEFIHHNPGCSRRELNEGVKGDKNLIGERLETLEKNGFIENKGSNNKSSLWITSTGMDKYDLLDAKISYIGGVNE